MMIVLLTGLAANAENYEINVGGVEVSSSNASYITGKDITSGYATYDASSKTLRCYNLNVSRTTSGDYAIHNRNCSGLRVEFYGTCNLTTTKSYTIRLDKTTTLKPTANATVNVKLTAANSSNLAAIYVNNCYFYFYGSMTNSSSEDGYFNITATGASGYYPKGIMGQGKTSSSYMYMNCWGLMANVNASGNAVYGFNKIDIFNSYYDKDHAVEKFYSGSNYYVFNDIGSLELNNNIAIVSPADCYFNTSGGYIYDSKCFFTSSYALLLNSTNFPDANFRSALHSLYPDDYLTDSQLQNLTSLNVSNKGISSMTGVEKFTYLQELMCYNNSITSFSPSSSMSRLTYLDCDGNGMTYLNLSNCPKLTYLDCGPNSLTSIYGLPTTLKTLYCNGNKLTSLGVSGYS